MGAGVDGWVWLYIVAKVPTFAGRDWTTALFVSNLAVVYIEPEENQKIDRLDKDSLLCEVAGDGSIHVKPDGKPQFPCDGVFFSESVNLRAR